jgi:8-oxo-dGTP diphosphatase
VRSLKVEAGDDAAAARWVDDWRAETLAFDHAEIVADAMKLAGR